MVTSSLDEVAPSCVKGMLCLPTVIDRFRVLLPRDVGVGDAHVKRIVLLRIHLDFGVHQVVAKHRDARSEPDAADVRFLGLTLVGVNDREIMLEAAGEDHPLHDGVGFVVVPIGQVRPDLVVG